ncbi:effector-associated constant component EACC1 [Amycolatopsis pigmentata]|uniref:Uncharacterized protein n=1 Tax=Amycolatopsis pigmentata TaxID=450801 RepID=A0ABW5FY13_9PSEU
MTAKGGHAAEVSISDLSELRSLSAYLGRVPGVAVTRMPRTTTNGGLGSWDVLQIAVTGGVPLMTALRRLPAFLRSRRPGVAVTVKCGGEVVTLTAENVGEVLPVLEAMLDGKS